MLIYFSHKIRSSKRVLLVFEANPDFLLDAEWRHALEELTLAKFLGWAAPSLHVGGQLELLRG